VRLFNRHIERPAILALYSFAPHPLHWLASLLFGADIPLIRSLLFRCYFRCFAADIFLQNRDKTKRLQEFNGEREKRRTAKAPCPSVSHSPPRVIGARVAPAILGGATWHATAI
jgi:hypothetical protein